MKKGRLFFLGLIMSLVLIISTPHYNTVAADSYGDSSGHPLEITVDGNSFTAVNPNYDDDDSTIIVDNAPTVFSSFLAPVVNNTVYTDIDALLVALREMCALRQTTITLQCYCDDTDIVGELNNYVLAHLYDETSNPKMGDYLYWNSSSLSGDGTISVTDSGDWLYTISLELGYRSTAEQEEAIDAEIVKLLSSTGAIGSKDLSDDYLKALAVYDYELDYYSYVMGDDNHSTYSAIINNETVCQGYATAYYRLARTLGLNSRLIASTTHGWNIVELEGLYYLVDTTWGDNPGYHDVFFLKGSLNFPSTGDHAPKDAYTSASFQATYPISSSDYVYDPITTEVSTEDTTETTTEVPTEDNTEDSTEASTESTTETTTENTTENTTEAITEDTTEASTEENTSEVTTETTETTEETTTEASTEAETTTDSTTEEGTTESKPNDSFTENGVVLYEDEYIVIVTEDEEELTTESTIHETSGTPTTEEWETSEHENPNYTVGTVDPNYTTSNTSGDTGQTVISTEVIPTTEYPTIVEPEIEDNVYEVNGLVLEDSSIELEDAMLSFEIISGKEYKIKFVNETGLKEVTNVIDSQTAIKALQIENADFWYSVKTKELGWLDYTKGEMTGVLGMDDYIVGIRISNEEIKEDFVTIITGACRDYADYAKVPLYYTVHAGTDWDGVITNGAINSTESNLNAIRIYSTKDISYRVKMGDTWLKPVSNWVLAGNPFSEESINGFSITGDNIKFRILDSDNVWSDWYKSGDSIELTGDTVIKDIQIYQ